MEKYLWLFTVKYMSDSLLNYQIYPLIANQQLVLVRVVLHNYSTGNLSAAGVPIALLICCTLACMLG